MRDPASEFNISVKGDTAEAYAFSFRCQVMVTHPPSLLEPLMPRPSHVQVALPSDLCCLLMATPQWLLEGQGSPLSRWRGGTHCSDPDTLIHGLLFPGRGIALIFGASVSLQVKQVEISLSREIGRGSCKEKTGSI